jgi:tRNA(Ile)-lysidine synthase
MNISLDVIYVNAQQKRGQSPEEAARSARYEALRKNLTHGDCLLTAQHLNDQAETLLLQLFRTASTAGLSAMPAQRQFGDYVHVRPLLSFSRGDIENYAKENALSWIDDPSNQDMSFDRNFIRTNVIPLLETRWPEITPQLSTVASLQANNLQVLEDMAAIDLANSIKTPLYQSKFCVYEVISVLAITELKHLSYARLLNVLRFWIIKTLASKSSKISPTRNLLEEIEKALINARQDANPVIAFSDVEFRKYQNDLYLLKPKLAKSRDEANIQTAMDWFPSMPLTIPALNIQLKAVNRRGKGLQKDLLNKLLTIRFRKGGEKFNPAERQHSQSLKKLFQEAGVLPWERDMIPLLYFKDELIAVIGLWVSKKYAVSESETGWLIAIENLEYSEPGM